MHHHLLQRTGQGNHLHLYIHPYGFLRALLPIDLHYWLLNDHWIIHLRCWIPNRSLRPTLSYIFFKYPLIKLLSIKIQYRYHAFHFKYFLRSYTDSCPFQRTRRASFLFKSSSSSSVHSYLLSPLKIDSKCSRFPETLSSFLRSDGSDVWYSVARTWSKEAN